MNADLPLRHWEVLGELRGKNPEGADIIFYHRIIGTMSSSSCVRFLALLNLTANATIPTVMAARDLEELLSGGRWVRSEFDPCIPPIRTLDGFSSEKRSHLLAVMETRLKLVRKIEAKGWVVFIPSRRAQIINEVASGAEGDTQAARRHSPTWIRKLLSRYWKYGGSGYALLPGTLLNGAKKREELYQSAKEKGAKITFGRKTGPRPRDRARPDLGPEIDLDLYARTRDALLAVVSEPDLRPTLARDYDRRRAVPWQLLTDKINERLAPKIVGWGSGGTLQHAPGIRLLTRRQVQSIGREVLNIGDFVLKVKDWKQRELDHHVPRGDVRDVATRPGQRYEVDVLEADVFAVHDETLLPIGRIFVAFVVDTYSRMIAAAYPWAGDPDVRIVTYALAAAAMPKSEWGRIIGEPFSNEEWPCQGLPEEVCCDNGEAATHGGEHLGELVFDVVPNPPYLAYLKQAVETTCRLAHCGYINWLPASTKGPRERGTPDRQQEAQITVNLIARQLNRWACHVANHRLMEKYPDDARLVRENIALRPIELWRSGCQNGGGALRLYVRERHLPALLESTLCRIVPQGIDLDGVYYDFDDDHRPEWFARLKRAATAGRAATIRVHYDRMILNRVYLVPKSPTQPVEEVPLSRLSREWLNYSRREYEAIKDFRKNQGHEVRHDQNLRKLAFGQLVAAETTAVSNKIKARCRSQRERSRIAASLGTQSLVAAQTAADTQRDQAFHPPSPTTSKACSEKTSPSFTYDELLNLR